MAIRIQFDFPALSHHAFHKLPRRVTRMSWLAWICAAAARWHQRRVLEQLDDRTLRDIGISRSQALSEAGKPFWRD